MRKCRLLKPMHKANLIDVMPNQRLALVIVIAIFGISVALAISAYHDYTAKAQARVEFNLMSSPDTNIHRAHIPTGEVNDVIWRIRRTAVRNANG
jgi:Tfp pilus assembly major pilin PilA